VATTKIHLNTFKFYIGGYYKNTFKFYIGGYYKNTFKYI